MHTTDTGGTATLAAERAAAGLDVEARGLAVVRGGHAILGDADLRIEPGELVAIVGLSGAGKTTLLDALAGVRRPTAGTVLLGGVPAGDPSLRHAVGYVPQDDLIHPDLPVAATLRYAARLRLPGASPAAIDRAVDAALEELDLAHRAGTRVADLSGGQRKRTSIGVELLTRPHAFFLDEPTSGLDPATAASLVATLRRLADHGATVVLTTHSTDDLRACDRIVVVGGGRIAFAGPPEEARRRFGLEHLSDLYLLDLDEAAAPAPAAAVDEHERPVPQPAGSRPTASGLLQWRVLSRRNLDLLGRNRLTLAIMLGAPALVISMFTMLFQPHALDPGRPDGPSAISTTFWLAFAAFFFGLTYGLLQICTEVAILRRERAVGLRIGPYLTSKLAVLVPVVGAVNVAMLVVLRALDRLPPLGTAAYGRLAVTLVLTSAAALALGLLASAAVTDPSQATLALPMLCFPAVLFAGAVLPVPAMGTGGRALSLVVLVRWSFEGLGHDLGLTPLLAGDATGAGPALLAEYGATFDRSPAVHWALLTAFGAAFLAATAEVLRRRATA